MYNVSQMCFLPLPVGGRNQTQVLNPVSKP